MARLLVVEDDAMLGEAVKAGLEQDGFAVDWVRDGVSANLAIKSHDYSAMVLDLGLPRLTGIGLLKALRAEGIGVPTIIITARDRVEDRIAGLDAGADDYVIKPFDLDELAARLRAVLRRVSGRARDEIRAGGLTLDLASREAVYEGKRIELTAREFSLIRALAEQPGRVVSRASLESTLYSWGQEVDSNAIEVHIHNLRRKLGTGAIATVRGMGYRLEN